MDENEIITALYREIMNAICCEAVQNQLTGTARFVKPANEHTFMWIPSEAFKARYLELIDTLDEYLDKAGQPYVDAVMRGDSCRADEFARPAFEAIAAFGKEINAT